MRAPASSTRTCRRRRIVVAATLAALGFPLAFLPVELPRALFIVSPPPGYDGCLCPDCAAAFGFRTHTSGPICGGSRGRGAHGGSALAMMSWLGAFVVLLTAIDHTPRARHPAGHCQSCGYDLAGCVLDVCPECGRARSR